jgi:hypothetical protein
MQPISSGPPLPTSTRQPEFGRAPRKTMECTIAGMSSDTV